MHRLQLRKHAGKIFLAFLGGAGFCYLASFAVPQASPELEVTPLGYRYRGRPFTGLTYVLYPSRLPAKLAFFRSGKRQGPEIHWYRNGQRWMERHYDEGLEVGTHKVWYPDGAVKSLKQFSQGMPHGDFLDWHSNGVPALFIHYEKGTEVTAKSWTAGGKPFYNYLWREGRRVGLEGDAFCSPGTIKF